MRSACVPREKRGRGSRGETLVVGNGKCLDVRGADFDAKVNGGRVHAWTCNGGANQKWHRDGTAIVTGNGKCLEVRASEAETNGGGVQVSDCNGGANQRWSGGPVAP